MFFFTQTKLLFFGFLIIYFSSFGQTFFISIFNLEIRNLLNLSNGEFGLLYSLATVSSSILLIWFGKMIDWIDLRIYALINTIGLFFACLGMFFLFNNLFFLFVVVFALRFFGQGAMCHTSITTLSRYFDNNNRGKAISFGTLGFPVGEMTLPFIVVFLINIFSWKYAWLLSGLFIIFVFTPSSFYLLSDHSKRHIEFLDKMRNYTQQKNWKIPEVLKDKRFYVYIPIYLVPSFVLTGLVFHQIFIATSKGWSLNLIATSFIGYAVFSIIGLILGGPLIDKINTKKLIPFYLLPLFIGILFMMFFSKSYIIFPYMALMGLSQGFHAPLTGALWAELYGVKNLGAVRALIHACQVFASALSPVVLGIFIDFNFSPFFLGLFCLLLILFSSYPPYIYRNT